MTVARRTLCAVAGSILACGTWAQQTPPPEPQPTPAVEVPTDTIRAIIEQEVAPAPGSYVYSPGSRRDPFISLIKPISAAGGQQTKKQGMEGFLIQEVALKGIVKTPQGYVAMVVGGDNKSYFVKTGQRLYDGQIVALDATTVTFRQEVADPLSPVRTRDLKKSLYPTEEARQ
jgi:Tfp pilus assembly protein PilP